MSSQTDLFLKNGEKSKNAYNVNRLLYYYYYYVIIYGLLLLTTKALL